MISACAVALSLQASGLMVGVPAVQVRSTGPQMMSKFNGKVWSLEAKVEIFNEWDPSKPRGYENFNPFERNADGGLCDTNGVFPGSDRGYKGPLRQDISWAIQQEHNKIMDGLKAMPKFNIKGQPGNWSPSWQPIEPPP